MEQLAVSHVTAQQFQQQSYTHVREAKQNDRRIMSHIQTQNGSHQ